AVTKAAAEKISISPWKRARDSRMLLAAKTSTRKATAAIIGAVSAARASTSSAKSAPARNGADSAGRARATTAASAVVSPGWPPRSVSQRVPTGGSGPARRPCSPGAAPWRATRPRPRSSGQLLGHVRHVGLAPAVQQRGHGEAHGHLHGHRRQHIQQHHLPGGERYQDTTDTSG